MPCYTIIITKHYYIIIMTTLLLISKIFTDFQRAIDGGQREREENTKRYHIVKLRYVSYLNLHFMEGQ